MALTAERLREMLHYDPETGIFTWRVAPSNCIAAGSRAGCVNPKSAKLQHRPDRVIEIDGRRYRESRLAFLYTTGAWPVHTADHIDRDSLNNRWSNLRDATPKQQQENKGTVRNSSTGFNGVVRVKYGTREGSFRFRAQICHLGKMRYLGFFENVEDAKAARLAAERELFTHSART